MAPQSIIKSGDKSSDSNSRRRQRQKQRMKFSKEVMVKEVACRAELTPEEKESIWISARDIARSLEDCKATVIAMQSGSLPIMTDGEEATTRGLEYMTADGFDITTSSMDAVKILIEEQKRQRDAGEHDDELLAVSVGGISKHRLRIAHLAAMKDARTIYGDNFKSDVIDRKKERGRSSLTRDKNGSSRGGLTRVGSAGALIDRTRRRRGSRGPLKERALRNRSMQDVATPN